MIEKLSSFILLFTIASLLILSVIRSEDAFKSFTDGVKDGVRICLKIFPNIFALLLAVDLFIKSGAADILKDIIWPIFRPLGIFKEALLLIIIKPFSGSASYGVVKSIFEKYGPDSAIGLFCSIICASTETLFYVISTYLAPTKVKRTRYLIIVAILVDLAVIILSAKLVRMNF